MNKALADVTAALRDDLPKVRRDLEELVRIPSISAQPEHAGDVVASAAATADLLRDAGMPHVDIVSAAGSPPAVIGVWEVDAHAPTVLLYAHHDVQPTATADRWTSAPFDPVERDGRLFGRGAGDDKAGVMAHVAAIRAWRTARGAPPVNVKVIVEGEEEIGSPHLDAFLAEHGVSLKADVVVVTDLSNWKVGVPAITSTIRGLVAMTVTVRSLAQPVHSGIWGGVVPDALSGMARLLACLHHDDGSIAVEGLTDDVAALGPEQRATLEQLGYADADVRDDAGLLEGVSVIGDETTHLLERVWWQPSITPTGMDVTPLAQASNTLLAEVSAKITCRLAPGQDPQRAATTISRHLANHVPWGLHLDIEVTECNAAWSSPSHPEAFAAMQQSLAAAYGQQPVVVGCGGTIPFVGPLSAAMGDVPCLLIGVMDPTSNAHGEDESVSLDDFARTCLAEAMLLDRIAQQAHR